MKNSAYLLPGSDDALEDFAWLRKEIEQEGGEAWIFRCEPQDRPSDEQLAAQFREMRQSDYAVLADELRALVEAAAENPDKQDLQGRSRKLARRYGEIRKIDFFDADGRAEVEMLMTEISKQLNAGAGATSGNTGQYQGRTWVTRKGVKVDRIASAWLIRRFIDKNADFQFVEPKTHRHRDSDLRFDMFDGEFTHEGNLCTFEVLLRVVESDAALRAIAEIVHDIDLKESAYQRAETPGVAALIDGIALSTSDDMLRIEQGSRMFDALYAQFRRE